MKHTCFTRITTNIMRHVNHKRNLRERRLVLSFINHVKIKNLNLTIPHPFELRYIKDIS